MKKNTSKILCCATILASTLILTSAKPATTTFKVHPEMHCQNCENNIKSELRWEKGIKKINTSLADQTVTVQYDPAKTSPAKIAAGLEKLGYEAVPTDSVAKN